MADLRERVDANDRLVGWKEIAEFLRKSVRTVQRWERELGLPIHRVHTSDSGQSVFGLRRELEEWLIRQAPDMLPDSPFADPDSIREVPASLVASASRETDATKSTSLASGMTNQSRTFEYVRLTPLGQGGFGAVFKGLARRDDGQESIVAIKVFYADFNNHEYHLLRRLDHPNIIKLLDMYHDHDARGNPHGCLVMEFADGGTLKDQIQRQPSGLGETMALKMLQELASALAYLHNLTDRIVHRDIKPANVLFVGGVAKLGDVGIAKILDTTTMTHSGVHTVAYAAPEMVPLDGGKPTVSPKADVYSLGITFFHALTGRHPFHTPNHFDMMFHHHQTAIPDVAGVSELVQTLLNGMTAKNYRTRWSADEVLRCLADIMPQ